MWRSTWIEVQKIGGDRKNSRSAPCQVITDVSPDETSEPDGRGATWVAPRPYMKAIECSGRRVEVPVLRLEVALPSFSVDVFGVHCKCEH